MVIIAKRALTQYATKHSDTIVALMEWYDTVSEADWSNVNEVKQKAIELAKQISVHST